ncbi:MAG: DNA mismatch repair endonuclease MutL [Bdellovibrionota bacterium]
MGKIHLLDDDVINKIAAGEVVERPASVVKELVENAIDAGASTISVELIEGGHKRITVTDNGCGLSEEDASLALKRHSTSKINSANDLFHIKSMGFRGEALASIAAVSRFSLASVQDNSDSGVKVTYEQEGTPSTKPWNGPKGTSINVESLFFNIPAREKFLKSPASEYAQCHEYIRAIALAYPNISFSLYHNKREQLQTAAIDSSTESDEENQEIFGESVIRKRAASILGSKVCDSLLYFKNEGQYGRIEALVSPPGVEKPTGKHIYTFVNRRWVKDKVLRYGIMRGYQSHLLKGKYPQAVVFLSIDPTIIDVNVHPAKTEMRFQYPVEVQGLITSGIRNRIRVGDWAVHPLNLQSSIKPAQNNTNFHESEDDTKASNGSGSFENSPYQQPTETFSFERRGASSTTPPHSSHLKRPINQLTAREKQSSLTSSYSRSTNDIHTNTIGIERNNQEVSLANPMYFENSQQSQIIVRSKDIPWQDIHFIGSFNKCYLFFSWSEELLVIDQHAFHERIIFERLCRDQSLCSQSQQLIIPEAIELSEREVSSLIEQKQEISALGLEFEVITETTIEVKQVPFLLIGKDLTSVLSELAEDNEFAKTNKTIQDLSQQKLATLACHSAVRSGEELGENELKALLAEASEVDFYHNCPHGRRVFRLFSKANIASWFDRT